jgi:hypothetical protein
LTAIRGCILEPARILLNSQKLDLASKFAEIHIIHMYHINSASSSHKEEMHLPRRNATISQKFMYKEECKNFLVTIFNPSPHSFVSMKFSSDCDHLFHEECGNSFTNTDYL